MAVLALAVVPACRERDKGVFRLTTEHFAAFHFQPQPGAVGAPLADRLAIEAWLLGWQGGGDQVINQPQHIGAVARAHQGFGAGRRVTVVVVAAAGVQWVSTAAGANGCVRACVHGYHQYFPKFSGLAQKRELSQSGTCLYSSRS